MRSAVLPRRLEGLRQVLLQHHPGLRVERGERLVEQQHVRIDGERARQRRALAHAAGQLVRIVIGELGETESFQQRLGALPALGRGTPWISSPNLTFSAMVRHGSSKSFCSMKATWALGPVTRSPSTKASPSLGAVRPEPILSSVLLPQPLGPISDTTSPSRTEKLTPCTAVSTPRLPVAAKRIVTLRYSRRTTSDMNDRCLLGRLRAYRRPGKCQV